MKMKETEYVKWAKRICKQCQSEKRDFCKFGYTDCQHLQKEEDNELVKKIKSLRPWWSMEEIKEGLKKLKEFTKDKDRERAEYLKFLNELKEKVEKRKG